MGTDCDLPSASANVVLNGLNDTYPCQIHIAWDEVSGTTGCEVSKYIVYYGTSSGSYAYSVDAGMSPAIYLTLPPSNPVNILWQCPQFNSAGKGPKSVEQSITDTLPPSLPIEFNAENINGVERKVTLPGT